MKILVIDPRPWNLSPHALAGLAGHEVVIADSTEKAANLLWPMQTRPPGNGTRVGAAAFNAILTELWFPSSGRGADRQIEPDGAIFALQAVLQETFVAICPDTEEAARTTEYMRRFSTRDAKAIYVRGEDVPLRLTAKEDGHAFIQYHEESRQYVSAWHGDHYNLATGDYLGKLTGTHPLKDWGAVFKRLHWKFR